nr:unnamed protein product [Digitaria exilis]
MALSAGSFAACSLQPSRGSIRACHAPRAPPPLQGPGAASSTRTTGLRANATKGVSAVCEPLGPDRPIWFPGATPPPWLDGR